MELQPEVFLTKALVRLVDLAQALVQIRHVVLRLLEHRLVVQEVALTALHLSLDLADLPLHVEDIDVELVCGALAD